MKLAGFRIQNLKSIIDTGWRDLSSDNITGLIGQNESGKSSILEGIMCFSKQEVNITSCRSDGSFPSISCSFALKETELKRICKDLILPNGFLIFLKENGFRINLIRIWQNYTDSTLLLEEEKLLNFFENSNKELNIRNEELISALEEFKSKNEEVAKVVENLNVSINENKASITKFENDIEIKKKELEKANVETKRILNREIKELKSNAKSESDNLILNEKKFSEFNEKLNKVNLLNEVKDFIQKIKDKNQEIINKRTELEGVQKDLIKATEPAIKTQKKRSLTTTTNALNKLNRELNKLEQGKYVCFEVINLVVDNKNNYKAAKEKIDAQNLLISKILTPSKLADLIFENIPVFELFKDYSSILPNQIDIKDIENKNENVEGYNAVLNFLKVANIDISLFSNPNEIIRRKNIDDRNNNVSLEFRKFWRQKIGKTNKIDIQFNLSHHSSTTPNKAGKPYLDFWVNDKGNPLKPNQRSQGVMWFLSFYLQVKALADKDKDRGRVLLIDEPGVSLHARAQEDVLEVFEFLKSKIQLVYSTHSPYLIDTSKVFRLMAVQRSEEEVENSPTKVIPAHKLGSANKDTLSPLYSVMGVDFSNQNAIKKSNNIILEEISSYYYFKAFAHLLDFKEEVNFLPSTGTSNIPVFANLFIGWGLKFAVIVDDDGAGRSVYNSLKKDIYHDNDEEANKSLYKIKDCDGVEDLFSKDDFKTFVLQDADKEYDKSNSQIVKGLAKGLLASNFMVKVQNNEYKLTDFDEQSTGKIKQVMNKVSELLKAINS